MANALEQPLLLLDDIVYLRTMKKHEVFLTLKRDLALVIFSFLFIYLFFTKVIQVAHMAEELVNNSHWQMKEAEGRQIVP